MIKISIIMPVYNVKEYLKRSIESVLNQSYKNWELILIDDGSTDGSAMVCDDFSSRYKNIIVKHQSNTGSGIARQNGVDISSGEYICFIDPDDYISEEALKNNVEIVENYNPDLIVNGYFQIRKDKTKKIRHDKIIPNLEGFYNKKEFIQIFKQYLNMNPRSLWNKLYKKNFLLENDIRFTDQRVGQDALYNFQVYKHINNVFLDNNTYYFYDTLREGSAVKKYNSYRVQYEINIINSYKELFNYWGESNKFKDIIAKEYWNLILLELMNVNRSNGELTFQDKVGKVTDLLDKTEVKKGFNELDIEKINKPFQKLLIYFIKKRNYKFAILIMGLYVEVMK
ncbi:glycosyltransferase family 2 protein [Aerococcus viridans]|uniref:glycosyltransferase family 2 protein n=1 Tax=Aerococcus viridans TaxID=1377 RepID=UPI0002FFA3A5|nr:glycosyltransferase family 2 protein [Aerococcus viridans]